jgi:cytochrome d ubiquinol oxidase subunit II
MFEFLDYETLRLIWWAILGILIIGFAVTDGFDLGVAMIMPFVATRSGEKRILLNSIGPFWEGNQVWLILGIGATFAAWPYVYAVSFSGFYFSMMLILFSMILRPAGFHFRSKINNKLWKRVWDTLIVLSAFFTTFILGTVVGSVIQGEYFSFNEFMVMENAIRDHATFNAFSALCGTLSVFMFATHGACYLTLKTEGRLQKRASKVLAFGPFLIMTLFAAGALFLEFLPCYEIMSFGGTSAPSNPMAKKVVMSFGCLGDNYKKYGWMIFAPISVFLCQILIPLLAIFKRFGLAFILSSISIAGIILTVGFSMFPFILPSRLNPNASLTIWDASSSQETLLIMLMATVVLMPLILIYTSFLYRVMGGKVNHESVNNNLNSY